ncbi:unnamed protein product [Linum trigynum]|uniref:Uncharacterized protein n=1 Tax=Linum trigynum TaxID=586398 RepID=A0AAV2FDB8_9ROSI
MFTDSTIGRRGFREREGNGECSGRCNSALSSAGAIASGRSLSSAQLTADEEENGLKSMGKGKKKRVKKKGWVGLDFLCGRFSDMASWVV